MKSIQLENLEDKVRTAHGLLYEVWSEAKSARLEDVATSAREAIESAARLTNTLGEVVAEDERV